MSFIEQLSAIALLIDFLLGAAFGVIGSGSLASRREDRTYSLLHAPPDPLCAGARVMHGVYTRGSRGAAHADDDGHGAIGGASAQGQEPER